MEKMNLRWQPLERNALSQVVERTKRKPREANYIARDGECRGMSRNREREANYIARDGECRGMSRNREKPEAVV